jgi:formylglycine-generating enzyme required for sulfatase activity
MVLVTGDHCPFVAHKCKKQRKGSDVCEAYEPEVLCEGTIRSARFCVDELEYPNQRGMKPAVLVDFAEAKRACEVEDKRLCTVDEWQFACEGEAMLPLPTGIERSNQRCNVDRPDPAPILGALHDPFSVASEMDRIDGRVGAGTLACTSPFGVHDLVGNVEEWADNPAGSSRERPFRSAVVGGAWGAGAAACRTVLTDVPATFTSHHRGFRCCADAAGDPSRPAHEPHKSPGGFRPLSLARRAPPSR